MHFMSIVDVYQIKYYKMLTIYKNDGRVIHWFVTKLGMILLQSNAIPPLLPPFCGVQMLHDWQKSSPNWTWHLEFFTTFLAEYFIGVDFCEIRIVRPNNMSNNICNGTDPGVRTNAPIHNGFNISGIVKSNDEILWKQISAHFILSVKWGIRRGFRFLQPENILKWHHDLIIGSSEGKL